MAQRGGVCKAIAAEGSSISKPATRDHPALFFRNWILTTSVIHTSVVTPDEVRVTRGERGTAAAPR